LTKPHIVLNFSLYVYTRQAGGTVAAILFICTHGLDLCKQFMIIAVVDKEATELWISVYDEMTAPTVEFGIMVYKVGKLWMLPAHESPEKGKLPAPQLQFSWGVAYEIVPHLLRFPVWEERQLICCLVGLNMPDFIVLHCVFYTTIASL